MTDKPKQIKLYKYLGSQLCQRGHWFLKRAFNVKAEKISKETLKNFVADKTGLSNIALYDNEFYLTDWATWLNIIEYDWTDAKKYLKDRFDCDNFANSFTARMAEIYGLNTAGRFSVALYKNDKKIGYHRANIIVAQKNGALYAYAYEPMTDKWTLIEKGKPVIIGDWEYRVHYIGFN